ncbi:MAG: UDP-N-acetylmuramoyl-tripeptide--D-alanyl-D-alanine ligase, partial [Candidatus Omnitrophica bacterium]|nr:UDP-N-acetylmuramoyl-tripeptide--D-alanyl-D-alanine ligase [Candidatus Omnitrophota bacterium]
AIGDFVVSNGIDVLVTLGDLSVATHKRAKFMGLQDAYHARSHKDAAAFLKKTAKPGDVVLVKGSRAARMEKIIEEFGKNKSGD